MKTIATLLIGVLIGVVVNTLFTEFEKVSWSNQDEFEGCPYQIEPAIMLCGSTDSSKENYKND